jgi:hypothetical protein
MDLLIGALVQIGAGAALVDDGEASLPLALRCRGRMGRSRFLSRVAAGSAAALAAAVVAAGLTGASRAGSAAAASSRSSACRASVIAGVLPGWARAGFSDPRPRMPYVLGRARKIAAILWADPLRSPPAKDHNNKILWVSRAPAVPGSALRISAQRMTGSTPVGAPATRDVMGSPGPSIINLPSAGCWRLTLRWSGRVDTLDLRYVAGR